MNNIIDIALNNKYNLIADDEDLVILNKDKHTIYIYLNDEDSLVYIDNDYNQGTKEDLIENFELSIDLNENFKYKLPKRNLNIKMVLSIISKLINHNNDCILYSNKQYQNLFYASEISLLPVLKIEEEKLNVFINDELILNNFSYHTFNYNENKATITNFYLDLDSFILNSEKDKIDEKDIIISSTNYFNFDINKLLEENSIIHYTKNSIPKALDLSVFISNQNNMYNIHIINSITYLELRIIDYSNQKINQFINQMKSLFKDYNIDFSKKGLKNKMAYIKVIKNNRELEKLIQIINIGTNIKFKLN